MPPHLSPSGRIEILASVSDAQISILSPEALGFLESLAEAFSGRLDELLVARVARQARRDSGETLAFLEETRSVRESDWGVASIPDDLLDRRVEITGPVDRKMIINALNSGAEVFMADLEDSSAPTWDNMVDGQIHLRDAVRGTIRVEDKARGKLYELKDSVATLMVRPRGLHLQERHVHFDGKSMPASLFDFGLCFFHNAQELLNQGSGPYFYLPKLESHLEARWWNDVFCHAQDALGIARGSIRATVLIETLPAAFEMDEILYELREHSAGLNCGRWDYIFSFIKTHRGDPSKVLPDRAQVGMDQPFLRAYTQLLVKTCHRRGAHAMGGMAAQIPVKEDPALNESAMEKVRADKLREVKDGHDGTWVAHPGLIAIARDVFDAHMPSPHQIHVKREDVRVTALDLVEVPQGTRTEAGLRQNVSIGLQYLEAWLRGNGCVPLNHLMEDAATAEISRTQIWQWIQHGAPLDDGRIVTVELFRSVLQEELVKIVQALTAEELLGNRLEDAVELFDELVTSSDLANFLTVPAYRQFLNTATSAKE